MSLKVWLPLNNNINNQGLTDWTPTIQSGTTATYVNGKIGKALHTGGIVMPASVTKEVLNNNEFSYACWLYVGGESGSTQMATIFGNNSMSTSGGRQFSLFQYSTANDLHYSWQNCIDGTYSTIISGVITGCLPSGKWTHIAVTYKNPTGNIYINGELLRTFSCVYKTDTFEFDTQLIHNSIYHYLNDVRLYDHALSPLEVSELAKGLVLHYRLSGVGGENLATNTDFSLNSTKGYLGYKAVEYNHSDWTSGGRFFASYGHSQLTFTEIQANQPYTISAWVYIYDDVSLSDGTSIFYRVYKTKESPTYRNDIAISLNNITERNKWIRLSNTFISSATYTYDQGGTFSIGGYNGHFLVSIPKVEKGSKPTPWCPNSTDELYSTMGFDDGIEYDCSGFGNNGTKIGGISWSSDTPRYSGSYEFDGGNTCITFPYDYTALQTNFTMNIWFKKNELGSKNYETLIGGTSGFEMDTRIGASTTLSLYMTSTRGGSVYAPFNMGEWYMVTLVNDGTNELYYVNGQLQKTIEKKPMPSRSTYYIGSWCEVDSQNYKGLMSDFRIYATALSTDDILALYNLGGSLDSNGTFHTYEYVEV